MKNIILFLFVLLFFAPTSNASDTVLDIQKVKSTNGIEAWLVEDKNLPLISINFSFKGAGSVNLSQAQQGVSQLLSNMMDEGAGDYTSQAFQQELSDHSISLSFGSSRDNFGGSLKFLTREKDKAIDLLSLALNKPRFDEEPLERMKQANITRIKSSQGDPNWIAARIFNDRAYQNHPYAFNSGGTITTLSNITANDLRKFKQNYLTKDRLHIGVSGNINAGELAVMLDTIFGDLPKTGSQSPIEKIDIQNKPNLYFYQKDIPQSIIMMAMDSIDELDEDYYTLQILNHIFGASGFGSRLMEEAREKNGLTYGIYSGLNNSEYIDALTISTSTKNETVDQMLSIIKNEMVKIQTNITNEEIKKAQDYTIGSMPLSLTNNDSIASIILSMQLNNRPIDYLDAYKKKIMAVTKDDVTRLSQKILTPDNMLTIIVGNAPNLSNPINITEVPNVE